MPVKKKFRGKGGDLRARLWGGTRCSASGDLGFLWGGGLREARVGTHCSASVTVASCGRRPARSERVPDPGFLRGATCEKPGAAYEKRGAGPALSHPLRTAKAHGHHRVLTRCIFYGAMLRLVFTNILHERMHKSLCMLWREDDA
jgi:hypothetical protein